MAARLSALALFAALVLAPGLFASDARAATTLGSPDPRLAPERYWCASEGCSSGDVGLRQLALGGAVVESEEEGVLVSASAYARRIGGSAPPRIVVLRPTSGNAATVVASAPVPVSSQGGALAVASNLHIPVEPGDAVGFMFRRGEVDLGVRDRPNPDGAVVGFGGQNGGTGSELLLDGTIEPDFDADLLGDETQDPDGGGSAFEDEAFDPAVDDFEDEEFGEDETDDTEPGSKRRKRLRLLKASARRDGGVNLLLAVPRAGRLSAVAEARTTLATARKRVKRAGRVRLELSPSRRARERLERRGPLRARVTVTLNPRSGRARSVMTRMKLGRLLPERPLNRPGARVE